MPALTLSAIGTALTLALVGGYGFIKSEALREGPTITLEPLVIKGDLAKIHGVALRATKLTLNGDVLLTDEKGNFGTELLIPKGSSDLVFSAEDRFGHERNVKIPLFLP